MNVSTDSLSNNQSLSNSQSLSNDDNSKKKLGKIDDKIKVKVEGPFTSLKSKCNVPFSRKVTHVNLSKEELLRGLDFPIDPSSSPQLFKIAEELENNLYHKAIKSPTRISIKIGKLPAFLIVTPLQKGNKIKRKKIEINPKKLIKKNEIAIYFPTLPSEWIEKGGFKTVYKGYTLTGEKVKKLAIAITPYNHSLNDKKLVEHVTHNDGDMLIKLNKSKQTTKLFKWLKSENEETFVMKYYDGCLLNKANEEQYEGLPSLQDQISRAIDLAVTIQTLHEKKITHRDIKLENFLLTKKNKPILCDFGFACKANDLKQLKEISGSYPYLAPEVFREDKPPKPKEALARDIWSLGCVLWILFFQPPSWMNLPNDEIGEKIESKVKEFQDQKSHSKIGICIKKMLSLNPLERPTIQQVLDELREIQNHMPAQDTAENQI